MAKTTKTSKIKVGEKRTLNSGAQRHVAKGKGTPILVSPIFEHVLALHCEGGIEAGYLPRNWEKGLPLSETFNSIQRHTRQEKEGCTDEDHARSAVWNWMVYIHTKEMIKRGLLPKELDDMPDYIPNSCPNHPGEEAYFAKEECEICKMIIDNRK